MAGVDVHEWQVGRRALSRSCDLRTTRGGRGTRGAGVGERAAWRRGGVSHAEHLQILPTSWTCYDETAMVS
jgi:hypothetical protein